MPELLLIPLETVARRPYVFVFLAAFLLTAWPTVGRWRTLGLLVIGYGVAFASEFSSIRTGFPYGHYHYLYDALGPHELVVGGRPPAGSPPGTAAGVPFFDSLSYSFLAWAAWATALCFTQPLHGRGLDLQLADTPRSRAGLPQWLVATLLMGLLDVIIDPVAKRGDRWFLGLIYGYRHGGAYFDIPLSNFLGWWGVAGTIFLLFGLLERSLARDPRRSEAGCRRVPARALIGPGLFYGVAAFNLGVTAWLGELSLLSAGCFILLLPTALLVLRLGWGPRASAREVANHRAAYPSLAGPE
jgi:putative membrane protein